MNQRQIAGTKDKILHYLSQKGTGGAMSETIAADLSISHPIVYSLLLELEKRDHVHNISASSPNTSFEVCHSRITNVGLYYIHTSGYKREYKKSKWVEFPKTYWYVMLILGILLGLFSDVIKQKLLNKEKEKLYFIQTNRNDTIIVKKTRNGI